MLHYCYVCGAQADSPPWGEDGRTPTYDFCPSCGCEHGYQDSSTKGIETLRAKWLARGGEWEDSSFKPDHLSLDLQLAQIPTELPAGIHRNR